MYIIKVNISGEGRVCSTLLQSLHLSDIPAYVRFSICFNDQRTRAVYPVQDPSSNFLKNIIKEMYRDKQKFF